MPITVRAALRPGGLDAIRAGDVYERQLFNKDTLRSLLSKWRIQQGTVMDPGPHKGKLILRFQPRGN